MSRKPSWQHINKPKLEKLCREEGYEVHWFDEYHARILTGLIIVDIWTPRMKFNVLNIDGTEQPNRYKQLSQQFNENEVKKLLDSGRL